MAQTAKQTRKIDYLDEDKPIPSQLWWCVSFLSPEGIKNCKIRGLKCRGVYATREDADRRAKELQTIDPDFHVFVGEVGKWLPWDPSVDSIEDQKYAEEQLQDLMKGYKENRSKAKQLEKERKDEMISESIKKAQKQDRSRPSDERLDRMRKKAQALKAERDASHTKTAITQEQIEREKQILVQNEKSVKSSETNLSAIEENIRKIKEQHEMLQKNKAMSN